MDDMTPMEKKTPAEEYNPEDEYTPLEAADDAAAPPQDEQEPAADELPAAEEPAPIEPPDEAPAPAEVPAEAQQIQPQAEQPAYPQQPFYPPYPFYGAPYAQAPQQPPMPPISPAPQQPTQYPCYPGWIPPMPPYYPTQQGAVTSYPAVPTYPGYPQQPASPANTPDNPYTQPAPVEPAGSVLKDDRSNKPKTSAATKAYLITLSAVMIAMIVAFAIYVGVYAQDEKKAKSDNSKKSDSIGEWIDDFNNGNNSSQLPNSSSVEEFEEKITLIEDTGETQQRTDDNTDTVGAPDPKAKGITLTGIPADKDDAKYTTQSAYDSVANSVVTVELYEGEITENDSDIVGAGTGTIISSDGYLITNAHVVKNSKHYVVRVILNSGKSFRAKVLGFDTWTDLAVLKIDAEGLTPVIFGDSDLIEIGQDVIAIGSPGGEKFQNSLTKGIVSAIDRELTINKYVRYIQSDAAISPGNSGGPLCNIYGQVVGINTAKTVATYYEAMTFSIPSATVKEIVNELLHYGYVRGRARIGFSGTEVSTEMQTYYGIPAGVIVGSIDQSGALAGTGIRENDIITAIDGEKISSFQDIYAILNQHKPGDQLSLSVYRIE